MDALEAVIDRLLERLPPMPEDRGEVTFGFAMKPDYHAVGFMSPGMEERWQARKRSGRS